MLDSLLGFLVEVQGIIRERVATDLRIFAETRDLRHLAAIIPFGVGFGAVHALTPGHSKMLLASYVAGSKTKILNSIRVASILSVTHILMSVVIALLALPIIERTLIGAGRAPLLEDLSRLLVAAIGAWMVVRAITRTSHQHSNGVFFGVTAGLIPCPLTLFTMTMAIARGIPEAGLAFAASMLVGVALTLSIVALMAALGRERLGALAARSGARFALTGRVFEGLAGVILILAGVVALLPL